MSIYVDAKPRHDQTTGRPYFSFTYVNADGKRCRLPKDKHPLFETKAEAVAWAKSQDAYKQSRKDRVARKLAWRTQFYQFDELLERYAVWQKDNAPNYYRANKAYLAQYVFAFFLGQRGLTNVNDWPLAYQEFLDWIRTDQPTGTKRTRPLAVNTINNIVKTLNTFITFLGKYGLIDPDNRVKCPALPDHLANRRDYEDVIPEEELILIRAEMKKIHEPAADFFLVLWHTGMRFNELFGLPITALFKGKVQDPAMHEELTKSGITYHGYLYLESQPVNDDRRREDDKSLLRKPLKGRRRIDPKDARVIPITTSEVWNILAKRFLAENARFLARELTGNKLDYVLFDGLEWNKAVNSLRKAYEALKLEPKSYHACRHSFVTRLVGQTRNFFLVRAITGHKKDQTFERYLHIYERIALAAKQAEQVIDVI